MASLNMRNKHYDLTTEVIDQVVDKNKLGNYGLGHINNKGTFIVRRIGRSDTDLNARLKTYIGKYKKFKFSYANSAKSAFEKECENYHDFEPKDNKIHPDRPDGTEFQCPRCEQFKDLLENHNQFCNDIKTN